MNKGLIVTDKEEGGSTFLQGKKLDPLSFFATASAALYWPVPTLDLRAEPYLEPRFELKVPSATLKAGHLRPLLGWHEEGIGFQMQLEKKATAPTSGNRVDLFLDSRDRKEVRGLSRFCHHFRFALPDGNSRIFMDGSGSEITHLVGNEQRPLALPTQLPAICRADQTTVILRCWIPATALYGFDPDQFEFIGFHFSCCWAGVAHSYSSSSGDINSILSPALWTSLRLQRHRI